MGMRTMEREILGELRKVKNNPKIKMKDIMEWSTGEVKPHEGEELIHLTIFGDQPINLSYKPEK